MGRFVQIALSTHHSSLNLSGVLSKRLWRCPPGLAQILCLKVLLWCAMVTRTISLKCEEAQEPEAKEAVAKEVGYHVERGTWDFSRVRELSEWMRDDAYSEVLVGRLFVTLGVKFAELAKFERKFRARAVYQGNNIWSRSGRSVYEIFDEVSNSPSSLTAARTAMALGMMRGMTASYRDASNAYLQALIDVEPGVINLVELPRSWWPRCWFEDDAMTIPKYKRPAVPLVYALPGHPKSGNIWEGHAESILVKLGWKKVADWTGVVVHADMSIICLYHGGQNDYRTGVFYFDLQFR